MHWLCALVIRGPQFSLLDPDRREGAEGTGFTTGPGENLGYILIIICQLNGHRYPRMGTYILRKEKGKEYTPTGITVISQPLTGSTKVTCCREPSKGSKGQVVQRREQGRGTHCGTESGLSLHPGDYMS